MVVSNNNNFISIFLERIHFAPSQRHLFHLVTPSPWPLLAGVAAFTLTTGSVMYFHFYNKGFFIFILGLLNVLFIMFVWWRDILRESTFQGHHSLRVQFGLKLGFFLFIVSEIMFFVAWFWAFFHSSLSPAIQIGSVWPPTGICCINPFHVPLLNTIVLLSSGVTVTWSHHSIIKNNYNETLCGLIFTLILGIDFTFLQIW